VTPTTRQAIRTIAGPLGRLAAILVVAAGLTLALGMIFPVQFSLDTAGYRASQARTVAPMTATDVDLPAIRAGLGGARTALVLDYYTEVRAGDLSMGPVALWALLGDDLDAELTTMPGATRVAGAPRDPDDLGAWIDVSADVARDLGVGPGDAVDIVVGPDAPARFTVRGVYAARESGYAGLALVPAAAITRHDPSLDMTSTSLVTTASADDVERLLNESPWKDRMTADNYTLPIEADAVRDRLTYAEGHSFVNLALVLTISAIALATLVAIVVAESAAIMAAFRSRAEILVELGARPRAAFRGAAGAATGVVIGAMLGGSALATIAYTQGIAGPTLPPDLGPAWLGATALGIAAGTATIAVTSARSARRASS
jgi:hypothetical protein